MVSMSESSSFMVSMSESSSFMVVEVVCARGQQERAGKGKGK
jgi:hypothetical protein